MGAHSNDYTRVGTRAPSQPVVADQERRTYRKGGITLPGRYYGANPLEASPATPDLEADARGLHPVNRRRFERRK